MILTRKKKSKIGGSFFQTLIRSPQHLLVYSSLLVLVIFYSLYFGAKFLSISPLTKTSLVYILIIPLSIIAVIGFVIFANSIRAIAKYELAGSIVFFIGVILLGLAILIQGFKTLLQHTYPIDLSNSVIIYPFIVIITGILFVSIGTLVLARSGGYYTAWLLAILTIISVNLADILFKADIQRLDAQNYLHTVALSVYALAIFLCVYSDGKYFILLALTSTGNRHRRNGNLKKALFYYNLTLILYKNYITGWNNRGNVLFHLKRYEDAIKSYKRALQIDPNYVLAKHNLELVESRLESEARTAGEPKEKGARGEAAATTTATATTTKLTEKAKPTL